MTSVTAAGESIPGDLSGDGALGAEDLMQLSKFLLGIEAPTEEQLAAADLNGDGKLTSADMVLLAKKILNG